VARIAGVSQTTVSLVERGHLESLTLARLRAVSRAVEIWLQFEPRWRGADLPRLLDQRHAALVELVVAELRRRGWEVRVEYSFNVRGERGSVDVLGWLPDLRVLLIIEVKTQIVDVQEMLSAFDRKRRVVPAAVSTELGWRPNLMGRMLVLPEETRVPEAVARHAGSSLRLFPRGMLRSNAGFESPRRQSPASGSCAIATAAIMCAGAAV
jgi:transcriptional regulator with XRE-family HTH domain